MKSRKDIAKPFRGAINSFGSTMAGSGLARRNDVNVNRAHDPNGHLHRLVVQGRYNHFTFKVFKRTTGMYSQEIFVFVFPNVLGWWPGQSERPKWVDGQDDITILLSRSKDAEVTLGAGWPGSGGKLGHDARIKEKLRGDVRVSHLCASEINGVGIVGV